MDEVRLQQSLLLAPRSQRTHFRPLHPILLTPFLTPLWRGWRADSGEKREPAGQLEPWRSDSLNALDPNRPNREGLFNLRKSETDRQQPFCSHTSRTSPSASTARQVQLER